MSPGCLLFERKRAAGAALAKMLLAFGGRGDGASSVEKTRALAGLFQLI
jgi:hypothetical protein